MAASMFPVAVLLFHDAPRILRTILLLFETRPHTPVRVGLLVTHVPFIPSCFTFPAALKGCFSRCRIPSRGPSYPSQGRVPSSGPRGVRRNAGCHPNRCPAVGSSFLLSDCLLGFHFHKFNNQVPWCGFPWFGLMLAGLRQPLVLSHLPYREILSRDSPSSTGVPSSRGRDARFECAGVFPQTPRL